ncbi:hypothetical protein ALC53_12456 [Atta colombica]|uniref:Uncharacterized protein n=1 Tax=Atta colombica TaxID=520822 RepID=A0A195AY81_9HYME|nr:hypothetical protein ALC53_12456 [Atta colombica]
MLVKLDSSFQKSKKSKWPSDDDEVWRGVRYEQEQAGQYFVSNFSGTTLLPLKSKKRGVTIELFDENLHTDTSLAVWRAEV